MTKKLVHNIKIALGIIGIFILLAVLYGFYQAALHTKNTSPSQVVSATPSQSTLPTRGSAATTPTSTTTPITEKVTFVGPRDNLPKDAPVAYGFWSFAQAV